MASADEWTEAYQEEWVSQEAREDAWTFDVQGWIHLPAALQHSEAAEGGADLLQQPTVLAKLEECRRQIVKKAYSDMQQIFVEEQKKL